MNIRRLVSYFVVAILAAVIWIKWAKEHPETSAPSQTTSTVSAQGQQMPSFTPPSPTTATTTDKTVTETPKMVATAGKSINVRTDLFDIQISLKGGDITSAKLLQYPVSIHDKTPIEILSNDIQKLYIAQSGLTNTTKDGKTQPIDYTSASASYELQPNANSVNVILTGTAPNGLKVTKTYIFKRNSYVIEVSHTIKNPSAEKWSGSQYTQFVRREPPAQSGLFYARAYDGAAVSSPETPYKKISYKDMSERNLDLSHPGGWVAMQQHYFLGAWVPENQQLLNRFYSLGNAVDSGNKIYTLGFFGPTISVAPEESGTTAAKLYVGPEIAKNLAAIAPGLDRTVDYGWLWWISVILFWLMSLVHKVVGNWGWAIVITTIIIKFVLYPLSATSFRSMAKMRELQPKMQQLKERFGDDRQALSRATMELYRKDKINPLGGCLPMLIQIPVFIGLYYVIIESVELRQAPFIWWIQDLSVKDPYYVLPILMGLSMVLQQRLTPTSPDPAQARMMMIIPLVFTVFFLNFPAGLTLYWLVNNCVQILQQWYVTRTYEEHKAKKAKKAKLKKKNKVKTAITKK